MVFAPYGDFVSYGETGGWGAEVNEVIDPLGELLDTARPDEVIAALRAERRGVRRGRSSVAKMIAEGRR
jgi:hypothetical protein